MPIVSGLPQPNLAKLGNILFEPRGQVVRYLALGADWVAYRTNDQRIIIEYQDGAQFRFPNQCGAGFENNTYFLDLSNELFWLYISNGQIFFRSFNVVSRRIQRNLYITADNGGLPSIAIDFALGRVCIYKSIVAAGIPGHAYMYFYAFGGQLVPAFDVFNAPLDSELWIAFDPSASGFYRCFKNNSVSKIEYNFTGFAAPDLYNQTTTTQPVTLVANTTSIYYPIYAPSVDTIFTMNRAMTEVIGWQASSVNVQSQAPLTIDNRAVLYNANFDAIGYERWSIDISTGILYDSLTYTALQLSAPSTIAPAPRYPICEQGLEDVYPDLPASDRQSAFLLAGSTFETAAIGEKIYKLDDADYCTIEESIGTAAHNLITATSNQPNFDYNTGLIVETNIIGTPEATVFVNENTEIGFTSTTQLFVRNRNTNTTTFSAASGFNFIGLVVDTDGLICMRSPSTLYVTDGQTFFLENPALNITSPLWQAFIWRSKAYFIYQDAISILDLEPFKTGNTFNAIEAITSYARPGKVVLTPNPFTGELYLYDRQVPADLRKLTLNLAVEDFTAGAGFNQIATELVTDNLSVGARNAFTDYGFDMRVLSENELLFVDTVNNSISVLEGFVNNVVLTGAFDYQQYLFIGSDIQVLNRHISFVRYSGLFKYNETSLEYRSVSDLLLEPASGAQLAPLAVYTNTARTFWHGPEFTLFLEVTGNIRYSFTFTTVGLRYDIGAQTLPADYSHCFVLALNETAEIVSFNNLIPERYSRTVQPDYNIIKQNAACHISAPNYSKKRFTYSVSYIATEAQVTSLLYFLYNQSVLLGEPDKRFELYFFDRYLTTINAGLATLTAVNYSWHSFDRYTVDVNFEVIV